MGRTERILSACSPEVRAWLEGKTWREIPQTRFGTIDWAKVRAIVSKENHSQDVIASDTRV